LLEAMEERQVTVFSRTFELPDPFFVIATQNPIDLDGTYPLPEAQLDRFLMRIGIGYPSPAVLRQILVDVGSQRRSDAAPAAGHLTPEQVLEMITYVYGVHVEPVVYAYVAAIVEATGTAADILVGASPRAALALLNAARAYAAVRGSAALTIDHVRVVAPHVLAHRLVLREPPAGDLSGAQTAVVAALVAALPTGKHTAE
jgi:MoxR-like ATPase